MPWDITQRLSQLEQQDLLRRPKLRSRIFEQTFDGRSVLNFCSNDYLGFAEDPRLIPKSPLAGSAASRLVSGSMESHRHAEGAFASYFGCEDALMFNSGFVANLSVLPAILGHQDVIFSDALNHASIIDGCRLCRAEVFVYEHRNMAHLEELLKAHRSAADRATIVSESYFSMDGTIADLQALDTLAKRYDAPLIVDEAHASGVLSRQGECENQAVSPTLRVVTLGKAFGSQGAFVLGDHDTITWLRNRARGYVFSTAPSSAIAERAQLALTLVGGQGGDQRRSQLEAHTKTIRDALAPFNLMNSAGPIIPLLVDSPTHAVALTQELFEMGVFIQGIRPPTVPQSRLRIVPNASHSVSEVEEMLTKLIKVLS